MPYVPLFSAGTDIRFSSEECRTIEENEGKSGKNRSKVTGFVTGHVLSLDEPQPVGESGRRTIGWPVDRSQLFDPIKR